MLKYDTYIYLYLIFFESQESDRLGLPGLLRVLVRVVVDLDLSRSSPRSACLEEAPRLLRVALHGSGCLLRVPLWCGFNGKSKVNGSKLLLGRGEVRR